MIKNLRNSEENINFAPDFGYCGFENVLIILKIVHFVKYSLQKCQSVKVSRQFLKWTNGQYGHEENRLVMEW